MKPQRTTRRISPPSPQGRLDILAARLIARTVKEIERAAGVRVWPLIAPAVEQWTTAAFGRRRILC